MSKQKIILQHDKWQDRKYSQNIMCAGKRDI